MKNRYRKITILTQILENPLQRINHFFQSWKLWFQKVPLSSPSFRTQGHLLHDFLESNSQLIRKASLLTTTSLSNSPQGCPYPQSEGWQTISEVSEKQKKAGVVLRDCNLSRRRLALATATRDTSFILFLFKVFLLC